MKRIIWVLALATVYSWSFAGPLDPDPIASSVRMPNLSGEIPAIFVLPNGQGQPFSSAQEYWTGLPLDATIELTLINQSGSPMVGVPKEDIWLTVTGGTFGQCIIGSAPDRATDENGTTVWATPIFASGYSEGVVEVTINGLPITGEGTPLALWITSADLNSNGTVNLVDVFEFSSIFFGGYQTQGDLFPDGVVNLADVGRLAFGMGASCP